MTEAQKLREAYESLEDDKAAFQAQAAKYEALVTAARSMERRFLDHGHAGLTVLELRSALAALDSSQPEATTGATGAELPDCDNMSGTYCPDCRAVGLWHCSDPVNCGGMRPMNHSKCGKHMAGEPPAASHVGQNSVPEKGRTVGHDDSRASETPANQVSGQPEYSKTKGETKLCRA